MEEGSAVKTMEELADIAYAKVNSRQISPHCHVGQVACALLADNGNVYLGVCIDTACALGFCAEHAAIAHMICDGESKIAKIVAVGEGRKILAPCGRCREFMCQVNPKNLDTLVMVAPNTVVRLRELLPYAYVVEE